MQHTAKMENIPILKASIWYCLNSGTRSVSQSHLHVLLYCALSIYIQELFTRSTLCPGSNPKIKLQPTPIQEFDIYELKTSGLKQVHNYFLSLQTLSDLLGTYKLKSHYHVRMI